MLSPVSMMKSLPRMNPTMHSFHVAWSNFALVSYVSICPLDFQVSVIYSVGYLLLFSIAYITSAHNCQGTTARSAAPFFPCVPVRAPLGAAS